MNAWGLRELTLAVTALCLVSCKSSPPKPTSEMEVYLMTYNVENLFDTQDDPEKSDETFLPLTQKQSRAHKQKCAKVPREVWRRQCLEWDWNKNVLHTKMLRLSKVLRQVEGGSGPDLVFLQEVENLNILKKWNETYLADLNYKEIVLIEGRDRRGIDVAVLSRFPLFEPAQLHFVPFKKASKRQIEDTRGILEATFKLPDGTLLTTYTVHFPAPFHPADLRIQAFQFLNQKVRQLPEDRLVVAAGDFNVPSEEDRKLSTLKKYTEPKWLVAHKIFCEDCKGTNYYAPKDSWSFLDMILLSPNLAADSKGWRLKEASIQVLNRSEFQKTSEGHPADFDPTNLSGVSDHWPLGLKLVK